MPIENLTPSARDYLDSFGLTAVAISPTGRVFVSANPTGASAAFWCRNSDADKAARRLHIAMTPHPIFVAHVKARTTRIEQALQQAKVDGLLAQFHAAYKQRRKRRRAAKHL
jgi:hypothetical protein